MQTPSKHQARRTPFMSIFPTKILLATDGSQGAELAATTAVDLAKTTGSELHVVTVFPGPGYVHPYYETHFPEAAERLRREARKERQEILDERVERIREAGGSVAQTHIKEGETSAEIVTLAEELEAGLIAIGSRGLGGKRLRLRGPPCPLPGYGGACRSGGLPDETLSGNRSFQGSPAGCNDRRPSSQEHNL
jgi:nucleotide-binding universal stress UspA family protein